MKSHLSPLSSQTSHVLWQFWLQVAGTRGIGRIPGGRRTADDFPVVMRELRLELRSVWGLHIP